MVRRQVFCFFVVHFIPNWCAGIERENFLVRAGARLWCLSVHQKKDVKLSR